MKNKIPQKPIATTLLFLLIASMIVSALAFSSVAAAPADSSPVFGDPSTYGDLSQYTWPTGRGDPSNTGFSAGPAPNAPDIAWKFSAPGISGTTAIFNGLAFAQSSNRLYAVDAYTGELVWQVPINSSAGVARVGPTQIDDTYLLVDIGEAFECHRIDNGQLVWTTPSFYTGPNSTLLPGGPSGGLLPGGPNYWTGAYSPELKMKYVIGYNGVTEIIYAYDLSNPAQLPPIAWQYVCSEGGSEILAFGDNKLFVGGNAFRVYALDAKTGELLWTANKVGYAGQMGVYADGKFYASGDSTRLTCYDADTGAILWDYNAGDRAYFAYAGTAAYGRYYQHNDQIVPSGFFACWDSQTGDILWQKPAHYFIGYLAPVSADGKIFSSTSDGQGVTDMAAQPASFTCFDAFSGEELWKIPLNIPFPAIAYGNLYGIASGTLYCIGSTQEWSMWRGNTNKPGVASAGPSDLSTPSWKYQTNGAITSSAAISGGKVYIGSQDKNLYCLDAYNGTKIWNFTIGAQILSSPAVYNGKVYTGADDGYIYCLNAATGAQIWKINAGGTIPIVFAPIWQPRSSPIIVNDRLYVGALDGKIYCVNPSNGDIHWTYTTNDPIGGSPTFSDGIIYIASTDTYIYALNATNGDLIWKTQSPTPVRTAGFNLFLVGTPVVGEGKVFIGGGGGGSGFLPPSTMIALDAKNGSLIWNVTLDGPTWPVFTPTYINGVIYIDSGLYVGKMNATNGDMIWKQWLGFTSISSVAYADDIREPKIYVGCDAFSIKAFNAIEGNYTSAYTTGAQIFSSPSLWEGKLYIGSSDGCLYCFGGAQTIPTNITASVEQTSVKAGETVTAAGQINPGLPNAKIIVSFTQPNQPSIDVVTTTDLYGKFSVSQQLTEGNWTATARYEGKEYNAYIYSASVSPAITIAVENIVTSTSTPSPTPTSTSPSTTPLEPSPTPTSSTSTPTPTSTVSATVTPMQTQTASPVTTATSATTLIDNAYIIAIAIAAIAATIIVALIIKKRK